MIKLTDYKKEHRKAIQSLEGYVQSTYSEEQQESLAWHTDQTTEKHYIWTFDYNEQTITLTSDLKTGEVYVSTSPIKAVSKPWKR